MSSSRPSTADKRRTFRKLHETGCFVIPNPWDIGSARYLAQLGFKALATTSAGFAFTRALPDGGVPRDQMLAHIREGRYGAGDVLVFVHTGGTPAVFTWNDLWLETPELQTTG